MVGRVFMGRYEVLRLLGEGGMGRVYLARQLDLGRQVVVKVMHDHVAADPTFCERFQRETLVMARFQHPFAVTLYDASLNDPQGPCIVMEYIRGISLDTLLHRNGRLTPTRVGRLLGQLCEVLQAAHNEGIIHRDLKPANLMVVDPDTPYEMIKVMDFGLAKLVSPEFSHQNPLTNSEVTVGTPGYMCPEQARGEPMDHRGDLYSVGAILYELLAGRLPFSGSSTMDVLLAHATEEPPSFAAIGVKGWVSPAVEAVVRSCLAKDPNERPASARELAERFEAALIEDAEAPAHHGAYASRPPTPAPPAMPVLAAPAAPAAVAALAPADSPATAQPPPATVHDPLSQVYYLEAWMPEKIAAYKLRGFVEDVGGQFLESVPGRIRVRLGGKNCLYSVDRRNSLSWLGLGRRSGHIDVELRLHRPDPGREVLQVTVILKPGSGVSPEDEEWRERCGQIYCDLRGYLMGQNNGI